MAMPCPSVHDKIGLLQESLLEMATCADAMVASAIEGLMTGNIEMMQDVIDRDDTVDRLDIDIESECLGLIAGYQPVAYDLRIIGAALKVSTDIERIADYAVDIARIGQRLTQAQEIYRPLIDLPRLTRLSRAMLHDALQAFIHHDLVLVDKVILADDDVDALYHEISLRLIDLLTHDAGRALLALHLLFAAKNLERISDHVVNIAERVSFIETGKLKSVAVYHLPQTDYSP
jgi:phosphate transport system protein